MMELSSKLLSMVLLWTTTVTQVSSAYSSSGFYSENSLQQTVLEASLPGRQRREIKQEILTLLGLHHKPKTYLPVEESSAPKYMLDLYNTLHYAGEDNWRNRFDADQTMMHINVTTLHAQTALQQADMVMSFVNHATKKNGITKDRNRRFFFDVSKVSVTECVIGAELRLYKRRSRKHLERDPFTLQLFRMDPGQDPEDRQLLYIADIDVISEEDGWLSFNVTSAASHWMSFPATNMGFYLRITDNHGSELEPHDIGLVGRHGPEDKQPFMVTFFKNQQQIKLRRTREAVERAKKRERDKVDGDDIMMVNDNPYSAPQQSRRICQKRTLYVSFKDLGWEEWIIAPKGYAAYFCSGQCSFPLNAHMNATNHAIVQTLVHLMNPVKIPLPCCAPTNLSAISVLYFDDNNNVVLKKFEDIVVRACGCH